MKIQNDDQKKMKSQKNEDHMKPQSLVNIHIIPDKCLDEMSTRDVVLKP